MVDGEQHLSQNPAETTQKNDPKWWTLKDPAAFRRTDLVDTCNLQRYSSYPMTDVDPYVKKGTIERIQENTYGISIREAEHIKRLQVKGIGLKREPSVTGQVTFRIIDNDFVIQYIDMGDNEVTNKVFHDLLDSGGIVDSGSPFLSAQIAAARLSAVRQHLEELGFNAKSPEIRQTGISFDGEANVQHDNAVLVLGKRALLTDDLLTFIPDDLAAKIAS
ncbi:MAG TPA: hypothetical protein VMR41_06485 [Patescibacteria group bacterium]|nr:hypothetical protein [Patescibacteria group bacterium]